MREIGRIVRLQIQRHTLKTGVKPDRVYDPAPLLEVPQLALAPDGVLGAGADGAWIVDVHHRAHPATKNPDGQHGVSVGFSAHYDAMRERFGSRIALGCAGENIIAESTGRLELDEVAGGLAVVDRDGAVALRLAVLQEAHPCRPFTGWALGTRVEPEALRAHLQFLDDGMRGFYCLADAPAIVTLGDRLVIL
jgi:hypothetical protein